MEVEKNPSIFALARLRNNWPHWYRMPPKTIEPVSVPGDATIRKMATQERQVLDVAVEALDTPSRNFLRCMCKVASEHAITEPAQTDKTLWLTWSFAFGLYEKKSYLLQYAEEWKPVVREGDEPDD